MTLLVSMFVTISMIEHICIYDSMVLAPIVNGRLKLELRNETRLFLNTKRDKGGATLH
jgi:hypothetical protein